MVGVINFDCYEVKFEIDEKGKFISVYFKEFKDVNKLVEEFMLFVNCIVVEKIGKVFKGKKFKVLFYCIYDFLDLEKLDNLVQFIVCFGYRFCISGIKMDVFKLINYLLDDI